MREHAFLGLQAVDKVQQDAEEAICDCQQHNDAPQTRTLTGQLRQGQREHCAEHDYYHDLHHATEAISPPGSPSNVHEHACPMHPKLVQSPLC